MLGTVPIFLSKYCNQVEAVHLVKYGVDVSMLPLLLALIPLGGSRAGFCLSPHAPHAIVLLWV